MQLLTDFYLLAPLQMVSESKSDGTMNVRGIYGKAEEFNNNNRRYPKTIMEREVNKLLPLISENRLLGELDHPESANVKLTNAAHMVTKLYWQGNNLIGESKLLNTPSGKVAQQLIKDGVKLGISSRGLGTLKEVREFPGKQEVNEDYRMVTFDLVADPSTKGAFPAPVNESVLYEKTKKELFSQQLVLKVFQAKLNQIKEDKIHNLFEGSLGFRRTNRLALSKKLNLFKKNDALTKRELKDNTRPAIKDKEWKKRENNDKGAKGILLRDLEESKLDKFMVSLNE